MNKTAFIPVYKRKLDSEHWLGFENINSCFVFFRVKVALFLGIFLPRLVKLLKRASISLVKSMCATMVTKSLWARGFITTLWHRNLRSTSGRTSGENFSKKIFLHQKFLEFFVKKDPLGIKMPKNDATVKTDNIILVIFQSRSHYWVMSLLLNSTIIINGSLSWFRIL